MYRDIPAELGNLVEPVVAGHGLELVDLDLVRGRGTWVVRVIVDTLEGDGRVAIERCAALSREIGSHLDAADAIPNRYVLEVSSPGLDRRLAREKDFVAACGSEVFIETREPLAGRRRFRGRLVSFDAEIARVEVDGQQAEIPFAAVARANTIYSFSRADFARPAKSEDRPASRTPGRARG
ncbi:MAG: ribosome maturation factor RimP [Deltaproteobacteria bacterium]|nr:ribosome maturation factor RimP [Deltaproteobacteria bacterium]